MVINKLARVKILLNTLRSAFRKNQKKSYMRYIQPLLVLLTLTIATNGVSAGTVPFFTSNLTSENKLWLAPKVYYDGLTNLLYGPVGLVGTSTWNIAQWNIPVALPNTTTPTDTGNSWLVQSQHARVVRYDNSTSKRVELAHTGAQTSAYLQCGTEFDLLLSANTKAYPTAPQGFLGLSQMPTLGNLTSVNYSFKARIEYENVTSRCNSQGGVDFGYYVAALVLTNTLNNHVLYYQIILRDSRSSYANNACSANTLWFWPTGPIFGVNDTPSVLGGSCLPVGGPQKQYNFEVASRIKQLINGSANMDSVDKNLNNWKFTGMYIGSGLEGSATLTSSYESIDVRGTTP